MTVAAARSLSALAAGLGLMLAVASGAGAHVAGVRFVAGAHRVVQGNDVGVTVAVWPAGARCSAAVVYKGGAAHDLGAASATGGRATWKWRVPRDAQPGVARISVACGGAGRATRNLIVIGSVIPAKIHVVKSGWSVRPLLSGSSVSYGVLLANESPQRDALDVKVLVNFVMADNRLIGSATTRVSDIGAGTQHALGGQLMFPGGAPIARLEVVVVVGRSGPATRARPGLSAVRVMPSPYEPKWTGSVEGEIQNDHPTLALETVELSTVVLDAQGNVIGGGSGFASAPLPPATRMFFKISSGMSAIPMGKAASAIVSVVPTYSRTP